jgi:signal recognition particle subunit SRP54
MEQLASLGKQVGIEVLPIIAGQSAVEIAKRAMEAARLGGFDVVMLDTAGRTTVDEALMAEVAEVKASTNPHEVLLVADALTGQDAVNTAKAFEERVGITGIVLTRVDGDGRGGAALSMRAVTGKPIKLVGVGEKMDALEDFHPARIANRILGMGDVVSLVEKAVENIDQEKAMRTAERMRKGQFDLTDMRDQLSQIEKIGGVGGLMGMIPGIAKMKNQIAASHLDGKVVKQQIAIVNSMTAAERKNPDILKASRKKRIAAGAGVSVELVNRLLKQHRQMADMMKLMGQNKRGGPMAGLANMFGLGGGAPGLPGSPNLGAMPSPEEIAAMQRQMGGGAALPEFPGNAKAPTGLPSMPSATPKLPGLPGLGTKPTLPGLGGFNPFGKKK